jgi:hypothetical protein
MTRSDFIVNFNKFITHRASGWLPEEATEELFLDVLSQHINRHSEEVAAVLSGIKDNQNQHKTDHGEWP